MALWHEAGADALARYLTKLSAKQLCCPVHQPLPILWLGDIGHYPLHHPPRLLAVLQQAVEVLCVPGTGEHPALHVLGAVG